MYLRAKYTKYKMAKTKFSIWRYVICEICKKNGSNRPFLASRVADTIFPPPIEGHHRQLDNQCKDPMDKTKDCRVGQLTTRMSEWIEERMWLFETEREERRPEEWMRFWPWNVLVILTVALFGLLIYLVLLIICGGSLDPSRLFPVYH